MTGVNRIGKRAIITGTLEEPRIGAWVARVVIDGISTLAGSVTLSLSDGVVTCVGTVVIGRAGAKAGKTHALIVGGAGGLGKPLEAKFYKNTTLRAVLADIMSDSGETLDSDTDTATLDRSVARWMRPQGSAGQAIADVALEAGVSWRVLRNGKVWLGPETWPKLVVDAIQTDSDPAAGSYTIAPKLASLVRPGVTYDGKRVSYVETTIGDGKLRQQFWTEDTQVGGFDRMKRTLHSIFESMFGHRIDAAQKWPAVVAQQNADLTVDVIPDDDRVKGLGMQKLPIRHGLPGVTVKVPKGARVLVGFDAGDLKRPYVALWEPGSVTEIAFAGGTRPIPRVGEQVQVFFPVTPFNINGVINGVTPFVGTLQIVTPANGVIVGPGNPKLLA